MIRKTRFKIRQLTFLLTIFGFSLFMTGCFLLEDDDDGGGSSKTTVCDTNDEIRPANVTNVDLTSYQWHLDNTGQSAFASTSGTAGKDINQTTTYVGGKTGNGVIVGVLDEGLEIYHEDLSSNVVSGGSWDFKCSDNNPTNIYSDEGDHGTSVAGLIAAADNSLGGRGVAPEASLKGFNFLQTQSNPDYIDSLGSSSANPISSDVDIFNMSFGYSNYYDFTVDTTIEDAFEYGVTSLRGGKGAIYVKSAGNGFENLTSSLSNECDRAEDVGISCQNANMDPESALPYIIVVGATNADGIKSSYSTAGSNLLISAPGGEYGYDVTYGWSASNPAKTFEPALITTDQIGCDRGYSNTEVYAANRLEDNNNNLNPNCDYTSTFNGTSSAAPVVSGAIALLLETDPSLTWRDIRDILINTADSSPDSQAAEEITIALSGGNYTAQDDWTTNDAGHAFHNWYGFGLLDVDAAVAAVAGHTALGAFKNTGWLTDGTIDDSVIENFHTDGAEDIINVASVDMAENVEIVETVQVKVSVTHPYTGDLGIELTSPIGTRSVLLNARNGFYDANLTNMVLTSNAFYDEDATGDWTLKVVDADNTNSSSNGTLTSWSIKIFGHAAP